MRRCQSALRRAVAVLTGTLHRPRTAVLYANRSLDAFNNNNNIIITTKYFQHLKADAYMALCDCGVHSSLL